MSIRRENGAAAGAKTCRPIEDMGVLVDGFNWKRGRGAQKELVW